MQCWRSAPRPRTRRLARCAALAGLTLLLASCGDATFTIIGSDAQNQKSFLVVSGDADDVAALRAAQSGQRGKIVDGDAHQGALVCQSDTTQNGHHLHFAFYGSALTQEQCQTVLDELAPHG